MIQNTEAFKQTYLCGVVAQGVELVNNLRLNRWILQLFALGRQIHNQRRHVPVVLGKTEQRAVETSQGRGWGLSRVNRHKDK